MGLTHVYGQPFLFAIALDARTIIEDSCRRSDNRDALRHDIRSAQVVCVDIGYFQSFDTWHSVATGDEIETPPLRSVEVLRWIRGRFRFTSVSNSLPMELARLPTLRLRE
ncbi:MAG: hypothetical protein DMF48_08065 [Verrucomicrobia bacterium]|nr:MAG: hypothetical protein DMF48_08065 [Verrucomicrobiota bacterium]